MMSRRRSSTTKDHPQLRVIEGGKPDHEPAQYGASPTASESHEPSEDEPLARVHQLPRPAHLQCMTTTLTPAKQAAALATIRRAEAAATGRPMRRTYRRGMLLAGRVRWFVFIDNGKLMAAEFDVATVMNERVAHGDMALNVPDLISTKVVDFSLLETIIAHAHDEIRKGRVMEPASAFVYDEAVPEITVFADTDAFKAARRLVKVAAKTAVAGDYTAKTVAGILDYRKMLPGSGHLPILSTALESSYWMPTDGDPASIDSWSNAFGFTGSSLRKISLLMCAALDGPTVEKFAKEVIASEKYGTMSARYSGSLSASKAFRRLNKVAAAQQALLDSDPLLAEVNTSSGTTTRLTLLTAFVKGSRVVATVSDGFKMKKGAKILIFDPGNPDIPPSECTLQEVGVDPVMDKITVTITQPTSGPGVFMFDMAKKNGRPLYASAAPFIGASQPPKVSGRWTTSGDADRPQRLDVPIDVALAGAPEIY